MGQFPSRPAASFGFAEVLYAKSDFVATITIQRPQNYNAYSTRALRSSRTPSATRASTTPSG